jgi:phosphoserine phosphatase RsbU/P
MPDLYIYPKAGEAHTLALSDKSLTIGRSSENDIVLSDAFCSGRHALIRPVDNGWVIQDCQSKNGVFLNGKRVGAPVELKKGDVILAGETRIVFDKEYASNVDIVDLPFHTQGGSIIQVKEILGRPVIDKATAGTVPHKPPTSEREQEILSVLSRVSQALIYHMPLDNLIDHIMDLIFQAIPMDRGVLILKEGCPEQLVPKTVRVRKGVPSAETLRLSRGILDTALARNASILISDVASDTAFRNRDSIILSKIQSVMCVPLWTNRDVVGVIYADRSTYGTPFDDSDLRLLTFLGNLAAVKIENARLFEESLEKSRLERELELAAQIQRNLLPSGAPSFPPYDIAGATKASFHVGGDYFDYIALGETGLGLAVADVSGSGVSASLLMASLRASLHAEARPGFDPAEAAAKLNRFVHRSSETHCYISFFFGILDATGMTFINAGHNPPILIEPGGKVRRFEGTGLCLGMFAEEVYTLERREIGPGSVLCLYTDGITEARNEKGEEFGEERLIELLKVRAGAESSRILDTVFKAVEDFADVKDHDDDKTCVIITRLSEHPSNKTIRIKADLKAVDEIRDFMRGALDDMPFSDDERGSISLAVHEICVNIALYAYPNEKGFIRLKTWTDGHGMWIEIRDRGVPFDPRTAADPDIREKVRSARMGGWGIYLTRSLMDGFDYRRENDENILLLFKKFPKDRRDDVTRQ